jgi:hypothetical protein
VKDQIGSSFTVFFKNWIEATSLEKSKSQTEVTSVEKMFLDGKLLLTDRSNVPHT